MNRISRIGLAGCVVVLTAGIFAGCSTPVPQFTDSDWISHTATGRGNYERGDYRRAADAYARAALRAQALDDADAVAVSAVNRAVCLLAEEKPAAAQAGVAEALADPRVSSSRRAELGVMASRIQLALGQAEKARQFADDVLKMKLTPAVKAQALLAKSASELALNDVKQAAETLSAGLSANVWEQLPVAFQAEKAVRQAEIAAANALLQEAAAYQTAAANLYRQADRLSEMANALASAGRLNRESGNKAAACDQLYRAARSLWAQGRVDEAAAVLAEGQTCAEELKDEFTVLRMAELSVTFENESRLAD